MKTVNTKQFLMTEFLVMPSQKRAGKVWKIGQEQLAMVFKWTAKIFIDMKAALEEGRFLLTNMIRNKCTTDQFQAFNFKSRKASNIAMVLAMKNYKRGKEVFEKSGDASQIPSYIYFIN